MADNEADRPERKLTRPAVVAIVVGAVVVVAIVVFLIVAIPKGRPSATPPGPSSSSLVKPSGAAASATPEPAPSRPTPQPSAPASTAPHHAGGGTVPLDAVATPKPGVVVHVSDFQSVEGKGNGIGEISGPAVRFDVTVTNDGSSSVALGTAVVNVTSGAAKTPADELVSVRTGFPTSVAPGKSATAVYTFTLAKADRKDVAISFDYRAGTPVVAFTGNLPS